MRRAEFCLPSAMKVLLAYCCVKDVLQWPVELCIWTMLFKNCSLVHTH